MNKTIPRLTVRGGGHNVCLGGMPLLLPLATGVMRQTVHVHPDYYCVKIESDPHWTTSLRRIFFSFKDPH